jgi:hypothetical protein
MRVYTYNNEPEARKIKLLLEAENIPCQIHSFETWGYDGVFRGEMGMGEIVVPDTVGLRAQEVVEQFVREERGKQVEDTELQLIRLEQDVAKLKSSLQMVYVGGIIFGLLILFSLPGFIGGMIIILLAIGVNMAAKRLQRDLRKAERDLQIGRANEGRF